MKKQFDIKKLVLLNLPYLLMGLFATNFGEAWRLAQGANASEKFLSLFAVLPGALQSFWPSLHPLDLLVGLCCGAGLRLAVYLKSKNAKKYRHGMEYGSAHWGTREDIVPYIDPVFQNNVILTKTESLTMNSRPKEPKTARNKNVLVIGGSGSGKTRFWLKPNLMQMHSSYVVTDPKGTILVECGKMLQRGAPKLGKDGKPMKDKHGKVIYEPYRIKVLNTINFRKSMHYKLSKYEKETIINWNEGETIASIYTFNASLKRRLEDFSRKYPLLCRLERSTPEGSVTYVMDKSRLSIRLVPPYSEERLAAARKYAKEHSSKLKCFSVQIVYIEQTGIVWSTLCHNIRLGKYLESIDDSHYHIIKNCRSHHRNRNMKQLCPESASINLNCFQKLSRYILHSGKENYHCRSGSPQINKNQCGNN